MDEAYVPSHQSAAVAFIRAQVAHLKSQIVRLQEAEQVLLGLAVVADGAIAPGGLEPAPAPIPIQPARRTRRTDTSKRVAGVLAEHGSLMPWQIHQLLPDISRPAIMSSLYTHKELFFRTDAGWCLRNSEPVVSEPLAEVVA